MIACLVVVKLLSYPPQSLYRHGVKVTEHSHYTEKEPFCVPFVNKNHFMSRT